jgi:hypothetical protein
VVGFVDPPGGAAAWDNFQCKHYSSPLTPGDVWVELGKLCYYTFTADYSVPRHYRFVAPHDVGPRLRDLLMKPDDLKKGLISNWPGHCEPHITDVMQIPLDGKLLDYVKAFDFSIVGYAPLLEVVEQHMQTPFGPTRFQLRLPPRPDAPLPPDDLQPGEIRYVEKLLDAYSEAEQRPFAQANEIEQFPKYNRHLKRSRQWFFQAEALNRFSRDHCPLDEFDRLKQQVHDGVVDVVERVYAHGFERVCATTDRAADLVLGNSTLAPVTTVGDKKGICHHLANEDKLDWVHP